VLSRLARDLPGGSGPYDYPAKAFGPAAGFLVAWSYWISIWVTNAVLSVAIVRNLSIVAPGLAEAGVGATVAIATIWAVTLLNCLGVRKAGGFQLVTTLLKLLPLLGAIVAGGWQLGSGQAVLPAVDAPPVSLAAINTAATFTLFAMLGFESALAAGDRIEDPARNVPRATLLGTAIAGVLYLLACSAVTMLLPPAQVAASNAPFALFFSELVDPRLGALVAIFVAIAALGALNGFVLLQGELPLALARHSLFPQWFAVQSRFETPWRIHILSSALATLLVLANHSRGLAGLFQFMLLVTTSVTIVFYLAGALAGLKLVRAGPVFALTAVAGLAYTLWAFYGAGIEASLWSLGMTAAGAPLYFIMRRANKRAALRSEPRESAA